MGYMGSVSIHVCTCHKVAGGEFVWNGLLIICKLPTRNGCHQAWQVSLANEGGIPVKTIRIEGDYMYMLIEVSSNCKGCTMLLQFITWEDEVQEKCACNFIYLTYFEHTPKLLHDWPCSISADIAARGLTRRWEMPCMPFLCPLYLIEDAHVLDIFITVLSMIRITPAASCESAPWTHLARLECESCWSFNLDLCSDENLTLMTRIVLKK
jgi:hypothetical protein